MEYCFATNLSNLETSVIEALSNICFSLVMSYEVVQLVRRLHGAILLHTASKLITVSDIDITFFSSVPNMHKTVVHYSVLSPADLHAFALHDTRK
jgi:hypothetical protein